ncbi:hypothetical protein MKX03_033568 [Papaver bracteatum]|nr:hypothetical protein MKX03_033568 [Papaver bracteatum]
MASSCKVLILLIVIMFIGSSNAQLLTNYYFKSCKHLFSTVKSVVRAAISKERRMGASLLRLHFHDCFVNGCDGSILLDDTSSFTGEQNANPNRNSVRGFNVIDDIKAAVEKLCPWVVSCADILTMAARESVVLVSSAHTIGLARCTSFRTRIYNETNIERSFSAQKQSKCPRTSGSGDNNLATLDVQTPNSFDNNYYKNLVSKKGLLHSDQQIFNGGSTDSQVQRYAKNPNLFNADFVKAMIKMGNITPLTGSKGEIRKKCGRVN